MKFKNKRIALIVLFYIILLGIFVGINRYRHKDDLKIVETKEVEEEKISELEEISEEDKKTIYIHISGAVKFPGLIELEDGMRLFEAVDKAGGLLDDADLDKINLALILKDQDKIYVPKVGEEFEYKSVLDESGIVNINVGTKMELMTLPGVGEKTADKIIEYREKNRFEKIEDIMNVPGIGKSKFEELKAKIII